LEGEKEMEYSNIKKLITQFFNRINPATQAPYTQAEVAAALSQPMDAVVGAWNVIQQMAISFYSLHGAPAGTQDLITAWQLWHFCETDPAPPGYHAVAGMAWEPDVTPVSPTSTIGETIVVDFWTTLEQRVASVVSKALGK
jgi:hypothetical protein